MRRASLTVVLALCVGLFSGTGTAQAPDHPERKVTNRIPPVYPDLAKRMDVGGVDRLEIVIRANGTVRSTKVMGGNPVLVESATDAVLKWKFEVAPGDTTEVVQLTFDPR
jgi:TonB family protein